MKSRVFIVAPQYEDDFLHIVCKTNDKDNFLDIYHTDRYDEIDRTDSMESAVAIAKKHGARKVKVI